MLTLNGNDFFKIGKCRNINSEKGMIKNGFSKNCQLKRIFPVFKSVQIFQEKKIQSLYTSANPVPENHNLTVIF